MAVIAPPPAEPMGVAVALAAAAGVPPPVALRKLTGGRNNRTFLATAASGEPLVLKLYHAAPGDPRDRLGAEFAFLTYAWERGLRSIPRPLACDPAARAGLYGFLPGKRLAAGEITAWHLEAALDFVLAVNASPRRPRSLAPASEACFSLAAHEATVARRVARLGTIAPAVPHRAAAEAFVRTQLEPTWAWVRARLAARARQLGLDPEARLTAGEVCISPSDFGFHNALVLDTTVGFLDFEYAGHDDPAKLACDFFCQPEVPAPAAAFGDFVARLVAGLGLAPSHAARCTVLRDVYRVKWACIMLNEFLPLGAARRAFAGDDGTAVRCAAQLARATAMLDTIENEGN
jgi:Phosphotransferase enzyme family